MAALNLLCLIGCAWSSPKGLNVDERIHDLNKKLLENRSLLMQIKTLTEQLIQHNAEIFDAEFPFVASMVSMAAFNMIEQAKELQNLNTDHEWTNRTELIHDQRAALSYFTELIHESRNMIELQKDENANLRDVVRALKYNNVALCVLSGRQ